MRLFAGALHGRSSTRKSAHSPRRAFHSPRTKSNERDFSAQPNWYRVSFEVNEAAAGPILRFHDDPIVAWQTKGEDLYSMTLDSSDYRGRDNIQAPDGKVYIGNTRLPRSEYEARVTANSSEAKAEA